MGASSIELMYPWSDPCNFRPEWVVRITEWGPSHLGASWSCRLLFSRLLGAPSLLAGRGAESGQVGAALGDHILPELSWFLLPGGTLELFHFKGL